MFIYAKYGAIYTTTERSKKFFRKKRVVIYEGT